MISANRGYFWEVGLATPVCPRPWVVFTDISLTFRRTDELLRHFVLGITSPSPTAVLVKTNAE